MSSQSIGELARSRSLDYAGSPRKKKSAILDDFVSATGVGRKTAIPLLRDPPPIKPRPRGKPKARYGADVRAALELLWAASGHMCAKRLVPGLPGIIALMEAHKESLWNAQTREKLRIALPQIAPKRSRAWTGLWGANLFLGPVFPHQVFRRRPSATSIRSDLRSQR